ncbi:hypothetical protein HMSSN139_52270 [Paenibacillus sp. HMSSN-139]|nr:hypothetical protein HMSSN139_52270 [Paenibacillus sp. HMSSN-139]
MNSFLSYVLLGLSLSAPIGPVNAAQLDKGIRGGFLHAWFVGLGALSADLLYMLLVYFGVVHFLNTPFMKTFLWLFGFFVLTYIGIDSLKQAGKIPAGEMRGSEPLKNRSFPDFSCRSATRCPFCSGSGSMVRYWPKPQIKCKLRTC